jgi:hypothetical protein
MAIFKPRFIVDIYRLSREGLNDKQIAKELSVSATGFACWKTRYASVRYALFRAKKDRIAAETTDWKEYVRGRLPPKLQKVWDKLMEFDKEASGYSQAERLLKERPVKTRQQLLVFSILSSGFNLSKALRKVGLTREIFADWMENDPEFTALLHEVQEVKKDFFEEGLIRLIKAGDSPAIIFANKTLNRDRGYAERMEHVHSGNILLTTVPIGELELPPEMLRVLLDALKRKQMPQGQLPVLPVESKVIENSREET